MAPNNTGSRNGFDLSAAEWEGDFRRRVGSARREGSGPDASLHKGKHHHDHDHHHQTNNNDRHDCDDYDNFYYGPACYDNHDELADLYNSFNLDNDDTPFANLHDHIDPAVTGM